MASTSVPAKLINKNPELTNHALNPSEHFLHTAKRSKKNPKVLAQANVANLNLSDSEYPSKLGDNQVTVDEEKGEDDEAMAKTRNLRPRRAVKKKPLDGKGGVVGRGIGSILEKKDELLQEGVDKKKKVTFSISLTRQEIEEDVYSFTGARPDRRPRKRTKAVQKILDNVFPGLWLNTVRHDSYKVHEHSMKG